MTTLIGLLVLLLAFAGLFTWAVKVGRRRGHFMQPAAELRAPGRGMVRAMYVVAALHVLLGIAGMFAVGDGIALSVLVVACCAALFYVACAKVMAIAAYGTRLRTRTA